MDYADLLIATIFVTFVATLAGISQMVTLSWVRIVEVYDPDGELRTTTDRMEVPGGWIYRELTQEGVALVFVPKFTDSKDDGLDIQ